MPLGLQSLAENVEYFESREVNSMAGSKQDRCERINIITDQNRWVTFRVTKPTIFSHWVTFKTSDDRGENSAKCPTQIWSLIIENGVLRTKFLATDYFWNKPDAVHFVCIPVSSVDRTIPRHFVEKFEHRKFNTLIVLPTDRIWKNKGISYWNDGEVFDCIDTY